MSLPQKEEQIRQQPQPRLPYWRALRSLTNSVWDSDDPDPTASSSLHSLFPPCGISCVAVIEGATPPSSASGEAASSGGRQRPHEFRALSPPRHASDLCSQTVCDTHHVFDGVQARHKRAPSVVTECLSGRSRSRDGTLRPTRQKAACGVWIYCVHVEYKFRHRTSKPRPQQASAEEPRARSGGVVHQGRLRTSNLSDMVTAVRNHPLISFVIIFKIDRYILFLYKP